MLKNWVCYRTARNYFIAGKMPTIWKTKNKKNDRKLINEMKDK